MRRLTLIFFSVFVFATGGAGQLLAATLCAHARSGGAILNATAEDEHECCRARLAETVEHCQTKAETSARPAKGVPHATVAPHAAIEETSGHAQVMAPPLAAGASGSSASCAHCLDRPEQLPSPAVVRLQDASGSEMPAPAPSVEHHSFAALIALATIFPTQHAPPRIARRHLLLGVFLI